MRNLLPMMMFVLLLAACSGRLPPQKSAELVGGREGDVVPLSFVVNTLKCTFSNEHLAFDRRQGAGASVVGGTAKITIEAEQSRGISTGGSVGFGLPVFVKGTVSPLFSHERSNQHVQDSTLELAMTIGGSDNGACADVLRERERFLTRDGTRVTDPRVNQNGPTHEALETWLLAMVQEVNSFSPGGPAVKVVNFTYSDKFVVETETTTGIGLQISIVQPALNQKDTSGGTQSLTVQITPKGNAVPRPRVEPKLIEPIPLSTVPTMQRMSDAF